MERVCALLIAEDAEAAGSLATWMRRQHLDVSVRPAAETMGAIDIVSILVGAGGLRSLAQVAREWMRAHRTKLSIEIEGRGRVAIEGTIDLDEFARLMQQARPGNDSK